MEKLLIADDVSVDRRILVALLGDEYETVEAANGKEVINLLKKSPKGFDCILLDIKMPEVDGFGVLAYMKEHGLLENIPVIALTALTEAEDHIRCYQSGVTDLLEKPYDQRVLRHKIRFVIDRFRKLALPETPRSVCRNHLAKTMNLTPAKIGPIIDEAAKLYADSAAKMRVIAKSRKNYDYETLRDIVHVLSGSSRNMGYKALYEDVVFLQAAVVAEMPKVVGIGIQRVLGRLDAFKD